MGALRHLPGPREFYLYHHKGISDEGLACLVGLDGPNALNLDDSRLSLTAAGVGSLADLRHLERPGFDAPDETMAAIGALPRLRMLLCQDTRATSAGDTGSRP
jgi:hypothetical protein